MTNATATPPPPQGATSFLEPILRVFRNLRVIQAIAQIVFVFLFASIVITIVNNVYNALVAQGSLPSFAFLTSRAGFNLLETPAWYSEESLYSDAFLVGIINTLRSVIVGLIVSTLLGILIGISLLSRNWLVKALSSAYVEILRNTPLLVQLIFWYYVFMLEVLPRDGSDITFPSEGVWVFPWRVLMYPLLWLGVWLLSRRRWTAYPHLVTGAIYGAMLIEFVQLVIGFSPTLFIGVGVMGAVVFSLAFLERLPVAYRGYAIGAGIVAVAQLALVAVFGTLLSHGGASWSEIYPALYISRKAFATPEFLPSTTFNLWLAIVLLASVVAGVLYTYWGKVSERTGKAIPRLLYATVMVVVSMVAGWWVATAAPRDVYALPIWQAIVQGIIAAGLIWVLYGVVNQASARMTRGVNRLVRLLLLVLVVGGGLLWTAQTALTTLQTPIPDPLAEGTVLENGRVVNVADLQADEKYYARHEAQLTEQPIVVGMPVKRGTRFQQGVVLSPEYMALTIGLIIYTSAFIGEIVRAGIQAVPWGQFEAARALGLNGSQTLQMIVLPQALRVIIPPLGNQYLNLAKNSTLASAIAFADTYSIGQTIMNQSGQSVTGFLLILLFYLSMSLIIALIMNVVNSRFQLVTR